MWRETYPLSDPLTWEGTTALADGRIGTREEIAARIQRGDTVYTSWRDWARIRIGEYWYDEAPAGFGPQDFWDASGWYRLSGGAMRRTGSHAWTDQLSAHLTRQGALARMDAGLSVARDYLWKEREVIVPFVGG
ncbi:MAG TPA: hypothetical protein VKA48_05360, partial [Gammaproteobacteria bacterium]|nr:hypothetical protein [Gammaproteobacteria bacterium]